MTTSKYICILLSIFLLILSTAKHINPAIMPITAAKDYQTQSKNKKASPALSSQNNHLPSSSNKPTWKKKCKKIAQGSTFTFKAKKTKKSQYIRYLSSNKKVARIRIKSGKLTAKKIGKTTISAAIYEKTGKPVKKLKCRLKVVSPIDSESQTDSKNPSDTASDNSDNSDDSDNLANEKKKASGSFGISDSSSIPNISDTPINFGNASDNASFGNTENPSGTSPSGSSEGTSFLLVDNAGSINNWNFTIALTLNSPAIADDLKDTSIKLQKMTDASSALSAGNSQPFYAYFSSISSNGRLAYYTIAGESQKMLLPQDSSMDGTYLITSDTLSLPDALTASYKELLHAGTIQGYILNASQKPLKGAAIHVYPSSAVFHSDGTTTAKELFSAKSDENGYYSLACNQKNVSLLVTNDGYSSKIKTDISISSSYAQCCNFVLAGYRESELYYEIFACDKDNHPVQNATVSLYDSKDSLLQKCLTDNNGRAVFCNSQGLPLEALDMVHGVRAENDTAYFNNQDTYHVTVEKNICRNNYSDVYHPVTQYFSFADSLHCNITETVRLSAIPPVTSIPVQLTWSEDAFAALNTYSPYLSISLLSGNGETLLEGSYISVEISEKTLSSSFDLLNNASIIFSDGHPRLPDGTYYLQIKDYNIKDILSPANANLILPLTIKEGKTESCSGIFSTSCSASGKFLFDNLSLAEYSVLSHLSVLPEFSIYQCLDNGQLAFIESKTGSNFTGKNSLSSSYSFNNLCRNKSYVITASFPYSADAAPVYFTAADTSNKVADFLPLPTASAISSIKFFTQSGDGISGKNSPVKIEFLQLLDSSGESIFTYRCYENNTLPLKDPLYAFCDEDGNYSFTVPGSFKAFTNLSADSYAVKIKLEGYKPIVTDYKYCSPMQTNVLAVTSRLAKTAVTTLSGTLLCDGYILNSTEAAAASIMLYDMQNHIVAGKDIPSGTYRYTLTDGIDGTLEDGQYKMVVRGNGIETYQAYISIRKDYSNTYNILCTAKKPGSLSLLLIDNNGNHVTFGQAKSAIALREKGVPENIPDNWLISSFYKKLAYTETISILKSDKASNEWSTGACIPSGSYTLSINADFCDSFVQNLFITKNETIQKNLSLLKTDSSLAVEYHFSLKNMQASDDESVLAAVCYNSDGSIVDQTVMYTDEAIKNGIFLTMLAEKPQKIILYNQDSFLTYYSVTPDKYGAEITLDCTALLNW